MSEKPFAVLDEYGTIWLGEPGASKRIGDAIARQDEETFDLVSEAVAVFGSPEESMVSLSRIPLETLAGVLADVAIYSGYALDLTPHDVLRAAAKMGWPQSEWPKVQARIAGWLA